MAKPEGQYTWNQVYVNRKQKHQSHTKKHIVDIIFPGIVVALQLQRCALQITVAIASVEVVVV